MLFFDLFRRDPEFIKVPAGDYLFREGEPGDVMYVLIRGEAEVLMAGLPMELCKSGDIVGELAMVDGSMRSATVVAHTDCEFAVIDKKRFEFLVDEAPRFAIDVMRVMADRLKQCNLRLIEATAQNIQKT
jgi:CRP-like cAMP-binding protein